MKHATIRFCTGEPDYSDIPDHYDWAKTMYSDTKEILPTDAPTPLGKPVILITYVDANLYNCMLTGRSFTGIIHLINQTPSEWYSEK